MDSTDTPPLQLASALERPSPDDADALAIAFLKRVLPTTGVYCAAFKGRGGMAQKFFPTIERLWDALREADRDGREVYFAVASLRTNENREAENVEALQSFRLDVDYGKIGHAKPGYADRNEAGRAIAKFCQEAHLPDPMLVESGGGVHVYWPLKEPLSRDSWLPYAKALKAACIERGLKAGHEVTADAARILRPPGTMNRKPGREPRTVKLVTGSLSLGPYDLTAFRGLLDYELPASGRAGTQSNVLPFLKKLAPIGDKAIAGLAPAPADAAMIADQCAQMAEMRRTRGVMGAPAWKACIGVLAFCEGGEALAHEWSGGDARYNRDETQRKFDACHKLTGATTCAHFQGLDDETRKRCEGCQHKGKINSPIRLGMLDEPTAVGGGAESVPVRRNATRATKPQLWELTAKGEKRAGSYPNACIAIAALGISGRYDVFHDQYLIAGDLPENLGPELSDPIARAMRDMIIARFTFDPGKENVQEALARLCEADRFDPVADYLDSLQWDRKPRLDTWLTVYLGAQDTPLNRAFGWKILLAGARRVRQPGVKFDCMLVLEGPQGVGKSRAARVLAGSDDNFSDQPIMWDDHKQQQEAVSGVWIHEVGELAGLRKADVEPVKSFLSRQVDRARPAYGRHRVDRPRRCIFIGTVNGGKSAGYLTDTSGGRRFWPVEVGSIDLDALQRDRDQLWAEAAAIEATGEELSISPHLYDAARIEQELRRTPDAWMDMLSGVSGERAETAAGPIERIGTKELLTIHLGLTAAQMAHGTMTRLAAVMRSLGWTGPVNMRLPSRDGDQGKGTAVAKGYERPAIS
jgi:Virulence-associated protein E